MVPNGGRSVPTRCFCMVSTKSFDEVRQMPDVDADREFKNLVGLDRLKATLLKEARLVLVPELLEQWSREKHGYVLPCVEQFHRRSPLMVFSGDVGTGKTTLADSLGDLIAREEHIGVTLLRLSLITRGEGAVGQMTHLISRAFDEVAELARRGSRPNEKPASAVVFVIDEADALAESRDTEQMHHEDRAGVNALIRGIDRLARERLPALVILCTNRYKSLDPAVLRRAAVHHEFMRPDAEQREALFRRAFEGIFDDDQYSELARRTDQNVKGLDYGYSFSDIVQRLIPNILLDAFPNRPVSFDLVLSVLDRTEPTRPFSSTGGEQKP